jgi:hypothetical protein
MKSFYTLVDEAVQNTKSLFCIGFYLPREVNLTNKEFKDRVYFSGSVNLSNHLFIMIISKKIEPIDNVL